MMPTWPALSRNAISCSPSSIRRSGAPSAFSSSDLQAGSQYSRIIAPIGVPGPTRVKSSLSPTVGIAASLLDDGGEVALQLIGGRQLVIDQRVPRRTRMRVG